jgi:hypothetical protein
MSERPEQVPEDFEGFTPDKHFLPDYHDCPDLGEAIASGIKVPIHQLPAKKIFKERPHDVLATTWYWLDDWGPYTKERWDQDVQGAVENFVGMCNEGDRFVCFPISYNPPTSYGKAYHDWTGASYPVDVRLVITYDSSILVPGKNAAGEDVQFAKSGLKFHLTTLIPTPEYLEECPVPKQD